MSDRRERIPAAEVPDPKLWKLPFWTEPKHIVQAEVEAEEEDDSEVLIEEEEIEIEPITAEQLEAIRQDAYNEGLEQGLVEGRQKGEKLGFDEGNKTGITEGKEVGEKLGYGAGLQKGEKQAEADADNARAELSSKLHSCMRNMEKAVSEQKAAIEDILPGLVISIAEAVVAEELSQGSEHIVNIVQQALNALPTDTGGITIECSPHDLEFLKNAQIDSDFDAKFKSSSAIPAGGCKIHSRYSAIDFQLSERWNAITKQYSDQLKLGFSQLDEIQKSAAEEQEEKDAVQALANKESEAVAQQISKEVIENEYEDIPEEVLAEEIKETVTEEPVIESTAENSVIEQPVEEPITKDIEEPIAEESEDSLHSSVSELDDSETFNAQLEGDDLEERNVPEAESDLNKLDKNQRSDNSGPHEQ